jgi:hypothetical protein
MFRACYDDFDNSIPNLVPTGERAIAYPKIIGALTTWDEGDEIQEADRAWRGTERDGFEVAIRRVAAHRWRRNNDYDVSHSELLFRTWYPPVRR